MKRRLDAWSILGNLALAGWVAALAVDLTSDPVRPFALDLVMVVIGVWAKWPEIRR